MRKLRCSRNSRETLLFGSSASPKCKASAMHELTHAGVARGSIPGVSPFSIPKSTLSEQNVHFARLVCDRAYLLEKGQIMWQGTMDDLDRNQEVQRAYLTV